MTMVSLRAEKGFYGALLALMLPIALQNLIGLGMNMMDTVMLGSLGEKQISASALANQPYFIFTLFMFGLCSGACVLTAQYWGKGDTETISRIMALAVQASLVCAALFTAAVLVFPEQILSLYTADREVIVLGAQFLRIIGFSYIVSAVSTTYLYVLRSVENVRLPLLINFTSFVVNTVLNWILIYGHFGAPAMGIRGSAAATLCARLLELAMALIYAYGFDKTLRFRFRYLLRVDRVLLRDFVRYSAPVVANEAMWGTGISLQSVIIGHMGSPQVAANSIAGVVQRLGMAAIFGMANAAAVLVGKQIGAGDEKKAREWASRLLILSVVMGAGAAAIILLLREPMLSIYSVDAVTRTYAREIINVFAVIVVFQAFNCVNIVGVLRGGGDTRFAMVIDIGALWIFALPFGALAGLVFHWPLPVTFFLLVSDEAVKFFLGIFRFRTGKWLRNLTR